MKTRLLLALLLIFSGTLSAQIAWHDPQQAPMRVVDGQAWTSELRSTYHRLPDRIRDQVRPSLWGLSTHSAGLFVRFRTDAGQINVRYGLTSSALAMDHMPATGVSGMDLYIHNGAHGWRFAGSVLRQHANDTMNYRFPALNVVPGQPVEMMIYLPLYNGVQWMNVGMDASAQFEWIPAEDEPQIVAYGTSILQGGCASRPGMAWTNQLSRRLGCKVTNIGFSGNGQMDPEVVGLLAELHARAYLIDCVPNMIYMDDSLFTARYIDAAHRLRAVGNAPIVLVEYTAGDTNFCDQAVAHKNTLLRACYEQLRHEKVKGLYYLSVDKLHFPPDGTVDGIHPNDLGMSAVSAAYEKILRRVLHGLPHTK